MCVELLEEPTVDLEFSFSDTVVSTATVSLKRLFSSNHC